MASHNPLKLIARWFVAPAQNNLRWGIALSLTVHALVLVWKPTLLGPSAPSAAPMNVVLVNTFTEEAPLSAKVVAQDNLDGGGQTEQPRIAANPLPRVGLEAEDVSLLELTRQRQQLERQQEQLLKTLTGLWQARPNQLQSESEEDTPVAGPDPVDQRSLEQNARIAAILDQIERYNERPRKFYDAPSAAANPFAGYVNAWRERVEQTGSQHYPEGAPTGELQATVTSRADGTVAQITLDRPSTDVRLNRAVRRIIELAQPFLPFPDPLSERIDELVITRTWQFTPGQLTTQTP
jgi:protein TonB